MTVSLFPNEYTKQPTPFPCTWDELSGLLSTHTAQSVKERLPCWSPVEYKPGAMRGIEGVHQVWAFVLDFDSGVSQTAFCKLWEDYELFAHSSFSHCDGYPKWRVVFPFVEPAPAEQWPQIWLNLGYALGGGTFDGSCSDASRVYFRPCCPPERMGESFKWGNPGEHLRWQDFPEITNVQHNHLKRILRKRTGRSLHGNPIDYHALAYATTPLGDRHDQLTRGIYKSRKQGWDRDAIEIIVKAYHSNETRGFGHRTKEESERRYMKDIDRVWATVEPDAKHTQPLDQPTTTEALGSSEPSQSTTEATHAQS